jgi:hypothetical protein
MRLPPDDIGSDGQSGRLKVEDLLRNVPFPVYGLIGHPNGLMLCGVGYGAVSGQFVRPPQVWQAGQPPILWQVGLSYDYPPAHRLTGHSLLLSTTDIQRAPMQASVLDADVMAQRPRYEVPEDVPLVRTEATRFVVERLPIADGTVMAALERAPQILALPGMGKAVRSFEWSFELWNPPLWVVGHATDWSQRDLFSALSKLAMVSERPDVLSHYEREERAWDHYVQSIGPQQPL